MFRSIALASALSGASVSPRQALSNWGITVPPIAANSVTAASATPRLTISRLERERVPS